MRREQAGRLVVIGAALLAAGAGMSAGTSAASDVTIVTGRVSAGVVPSGDAVVFGGDGFAPLSAVQVSVESERKEVLRADIGGGFQTQIRLGGSPGFRALAATGSDAAGRPRIVATTVRVTEAADGPSSGSASTTAVALAAGFGSVALVAAARVVGHRRRVVRRERLA